MDKDNNGGLSASEFGDFENEIVGSDPLTDDIMDNIKQLYERNKDGSITYDGAYAIKYFLTIQ